MVSSVRRAQLRRRKRAGKAFRAGYALALISALSFLLQATWGSICPAALAAGTASAAGLVALVLVKAASAAGRKKGLRAASADMVDLMTGEEFEEYLKARFEACGCRVRLTPRSQDYGADLVVRLGGSVMLVQAKKKKGGSIGIEAVQQIVAAKAVYRKAKPAKLAVITNQRFTANARNLADANGVELWERQDLDRNFGRIRRTGRL